MSSTQRPIMMNGSVHAILMFILIPTKIANPCAPNKDRMTSEKPTKVIKILNLIKVLTRKKIETAVTRTIDMAVIFQLAFVMSRKILAKVSAAALS